MVSMPQPPPRCQGIFNLSAGPRALRAKFESLWLHTRGRKGAWTQVCLLLSVSAWRLFSSKPVSRAQPLIWDHLQQGGGVSSKGQCANPWSSSSSGNPAAVEGTGQGCRAAGEWLEGHTEVFWGVCVPTHQPDCASV